MSCNKLLSVVLVLVVAAAASAQSPPTWFRTIQKRTLPGPVGGCSCLAVGDVDGDSDLDVAFGTRATLAWPLQQTRLWRNDGHGVFDDETGTALPVDSAATAAIALADVDGDGDLDLVIGNEGQDRLFRNDGSGHFTDVTATAMPVRSNHTRGIALGDVDGDGDLDLVVGEFDVTSQDRLYLNNGQGVFTDATASALPPSGDQTRAVLLVDVDGDGDLDLVTANEPLRNLQQQVVVPGTTRLYRNNGQGVFTDVTTASLPYLERATTSLAVGDVDGDGDRDLIVGAQEGTLLYRNDGAGHFTDVSAQLPVGVFSAAGLALGDVDRDGDLDLAIGRLFQTPALLINDGQGRFANVTAARLPDRVSEFCAVAVADVDGDLDIDLLFANSAQSGIPAQNWIYLNDGAGAFTDVCDAGLTANGGNVRALAIGDLDGDGDQDLLRGTAIGTLVHANDGKGRYLPRVGATAFLGTAMCRAIALGDVDGDGDLDLFSGSRNAVGAGNSDQLFLNNGQGGFTSRPAWLVIPDTTHAATFADLDGDGDLDLAIARSGGSNVIRRNDGFGNFGPETPIGPLVYADAVAVGDLDGDGDLDLVFGQEGQSSIYRNDGAWQFTDVTAAWLPAQTAETLALALVDVDGDGDLDLVFGNQRLSTWSGRNWLYRNDGTGHFTDITTQALPADTDDTCAIAVLDFDLDGDLDLVMGNGGDLRSQQSRLYRNDGFGHFSDVTASGLPALPGHTTALAVADVDDDGDPDLVMGDFQTQTFVLRNQHRQLYAPVFPRQGTVYPLEITAMPGYAPASQIAIVGLNLAEITPRIQVPSLGAFGVDPVGMVAPWVAINASGFANLPLALPPGNSLRGAPLCAQALILHTPSSQDWHFTNLHVDVIQ